MVADASLDPRGRRLVRVNRLFDATNSYVERLLFAPEALRPRLLQGVAAAGLGTTVPRVAGAIHQAFKAARAERVAFLQNWTQVQFARPVAAVTAGAIVAEGTQEVVRGVAPTVRSNVRGFFHR